MFSVFVPTVGIMYFATYEEARDYACEAIKKSVAVCPTTTISHSSGVVVAIVTDDADGTIVHPLNRKYAK